jgi:membrane protease YdiL (CAAX protease family)
MTPRDQATPVFTAICFFIATVVVIQLWLVSAALDALLGGRTAVAAPAAAASVVLFLVNGAFLLYAVALDRRTRRPDANGRP